MLAGPTVTSALRSILRLDLSGAPPGTAQTPLATLAGQLGQLGHEVTIVTLDPSIETSVTFEEAPFRMVYCPYRGEPRYRARTRCLDLFEREIRSVHHAIVRERPDIVHAHWTYEYAEAAVRSGFPHLVTMHDLGWDYLLQFRDIYRSFRLIMKYRTMPRVRRLSVVAPFMAPKARQYGYFGPVAIIPNSVDAPPCELHFSKRNLKAPKIVTVGNPGRIKNVRSSIAAFRRVRAVMPLAELHLFGPGLDDTFVRGEAGVQGHGSVPHDRLMDFLSREATLLVHPARLETFGVIVAEAKARGVPVVAGRRSGGVAYVCDDQVSALVDIEKPAEIAEAVLGLLSSEEGYGVACSLSRQDVEQRFSSKAVALQYLDAYRDVALQFSTQRRIGS